MRKNYNYPDKIYTVTCSICGSSFNIKYNTWRHKKNSMDWKCPACMKRVRAKLLIERFNNNPELKEKLHNGRNNYWNSLSDEEKEKRKQRFIEARNNYWNSLSDEEKEKLREQQSEKMKERWNSLSDEEKAKYSQRTIEQWKNLSDEEKEEFALNVSIRWDNFSDEKKLDIINKRRKTNNKKSDSEKEMINKKHSESSKNYWNSLSDEKKELYSIRAKENYNGDGYIKWWNNLSNEEKLSFIRSNLSKSNSCNIGNGFNKKFEDMFNNSILINNYYFKSEFGSVNETSHLWDYAIYEKSSNQLQMLVDLDGAYFHADNCDYDGFHSKEEYDEKRFLSIPKGVKSCIIQELQLKKSFDLMIKELIMSYDDYIKSIFDNCRKIQFPYPHYSDNELIKSISDLYKMNCDDIYHQSLSLNTKIGDRVIYHFHESIYHAHVKSRSSPYEAWYNDELLMRCIKNRVIYQSYLNPNKILQGFNVSKIAPKVSVFSAGRAKMIINKYIKDYNEIFDPFSGFSGRMLGAISLNKYYIGQDINEVHIEESNNIIKHFGLSSIVIQADVTNSFGTYETLFTCPPYKDKEIWINHSTDKIYTCDEWIDICLTHFRCKRYVFIVDNTEKYTNYIQDIIINKSHFGSNNEYIIIIDK